MSRSDKSNGMTGPGCLVPPEQARFASHSFTAPCWGWARATCICRWPWTASPTRAGGEWFEDGLQCRGGPCRGTQLLFRVTCQFSDYSPLGHGLIGIRCHRARIVGSCWLAVVT